ncbi:unnamed protein product [Owenia fusiformis]|uniref:Uncharacterized protein n=1 Tax=Owenia fusiformis TaxID=6347 RepID=A0A8S4PIU9_OWEFU|nr:unnamed protein product [Owenia fusiformis]
MASFSTGTLSCAATLIIGFMCIDTACYAFNYQPDRKIGINKYPEDNRILGNIERNRRSSDVGGDVTVSDQSGLNKNITVSRAWWTVPAIPVNSIDLVAAIILGILGGLFLMVCFISAVKACRDRKAIKLRIALRRELKKNAIKVLHEYSSLNNQAERNGKIGRNVRNGQVNHGLDITDETTQVVEVTVHKEYTAQNTPQKGQPMEESTADKSPRSLKELAREISKSEIVIPNGNVVPDDEHGDHIPVMNGNHNTVHQNGNHVNGNGVVCHGNGTATKGNSIHSNPKHNINNTHTDSESCNGLPSSPLASDSTSTFPRVKNGIGRGLGYRHSYQGAEITRFHEKQVINKFKQFRKVKSDNTLIKANGVKKELGKRLSDKNANSIEESDQIPEGAFDDVTIQ